MISLCLLFEKGGYYGSGNTDATKSFNYDEGSISRYIQANIKDKSEPIKKSKPVPEDNFPLTPGQIRHNELEKERMKQEGIKAEYHRKLRQQKAEELQAIKTAAKQKRAHESKIKRDIQKSNSLISFLKNQKKHLETKL
jgi:hypothetical protein